MALASRCVFESLGEPQTVPHCCRRFKYLRKLWSRSDIGPRTSRSSQGSNRGRRFEHPSEIGLLLSIRRQAVPAFGEDCDAIQKFQFEELYAVRPYRIPFEACVVLNSPSDRKSVV